MTEHQIIANFEMSGELEMNLRNGFLEEGDMAGVSKTVHNFRCICGEEFDSKAEARDHVT